MRIQVESLSKSFGKLRVLDDVSLDLPAGKVVALLGPNGAGKTTLLRCLTGILVPDEGRILFGGQPYDREDLPLRRRMAFLPDEVATEPGLTVLDHAGMVLRLYQVEEEPAVERILELLRRFDMLATAPLTVQTLSRGQTYKAGLIPLMATEPEVLILDEPFASGMDPPGLLAMRDFSRAITDRGGTVIYTTQIMDVVERFADMVCVLHKGKVLGCDTLEGLLEGIEHEGEGLYALFRKLREEEAPRPARDPEGS